MTSFEHDGLALAYDDSREADLTPVVFLHGLSSARSTWAPVVAALRGRYRTVTLDDRGHGESDHAPGTYTLAHYADDAVGFLDAVVGGPAVLVGHSLGGVIAHRVAMDRPDLARGVILEDPPLYVTTRQRDATTSPIVALFGVMETVYGDMQARGAAIEEYEALVRSAPAMNGAGTMAEVLGEEGTRSQAKAMAGLDPGIFAPAIDGTAITPVATERQLPCPALVLRADPDKGSAAFTADDADAFLAANPHARVVMIEGTSHMVHDDARDRFIAEVEHFLASI